MLSLLKYFWLTSLVFISSTRSEYSSGLVPEYHPGIARPAAVDYDVAYGKDSKQKMDIYLPEHRNTSTTISIIVIHGGSWSNGDKSDLNPYVSQLQAKLPGYAIFNVNYRLASRNGGNRFPAQEDDIKAAVEFIYSKRKEYNISDRIVYLGASAGGHLALLQAYKHNDVVKPEAVISFFGPTDLAALYNSNPLAGMLLSNLIGSSPTANAELYKQSSPASFVSKNSAPTLLLHGGADPMVPTEQATLLLDLLKSAGVDNEYILYPSASHGWYGKTLDDSFEKVAGFLKKHVD
jgi:acetyl esterase/lipase